VIGDTIKVIIPASGAGVRFGAAVPKQFLELCGVHILKRTISIFQEMDEIDEIVVAVSPGYAEMVQAYGLSKARIVEGGENRAASVYAALNTLSTNTGIVLIHDGVRPFTTPCLVRAVIAAVKKYGAAVPCIPVTDTIKQVDPHGKITATHDREKLWRAQTPQGFTYDIITAAYRQAEKGGMEATDDSVLVERMGVPVYVVPSEVGNIKITTPEDLIPISR